MSNAMNQIQIEMRYENASGNTKSQVVGIDNDLEYGYEQLHKLFEGVNWDAFHASRYGIPSSAHYDFEWQADGVDHCTVEIVELYVGNINKVDDYSNEPISTIVKYFELGGYPEFSQESEQSLRAEYKRLGELIAQL
ncbi:hypothetical protein F7U66_11020 [Vibrio parahaemolyticus]|nr:hypothetical protein [Vibrio parahaemolyticus]